MKHREDDSTSVGDMSGTQLSSWGFHARGFPVPSFPVQFFPSASSSIAGFSLLLLVFPVVVSGAARGQASKPVTLERHYREGERVAYKMQATNEGHVHNIRYEARVSAVVKRNTAVFLWRISPGRTCRSMGSRWR